MYENTVPQTPAEKIMQHLQEKLSAYENITTDQYPINDPLTIEEYMSMTPQEHIALHFKWLSVSQKYCHRQHQLFYMEQSIMKYVVYDITSKKLGNKYRIYKQRYTLWKKISDSVEV